MSELKVESIQVPGILEKMATNEWMMPYFQRDFVWSTANVTQLILSIIDAQPIGMATLWEQEDNSPLQLEPVSVADRNEDDNSNRKFFSDPNIKASRRFAVLDGRQRCTAIAMAFGGLRTEKKSRFWGRYFLNVEAVDPTERVVFIKETDVKRKGYDVDNTCISAGLFPLTSNIKDEGILQQWMRYLQAIRDQANYPDGKLPSAEILNKRNQILQDAFGGINGTKLAIYVVPRTYGLGKICEIFETLNTTGTKVSTVDLIHSWLYSETARDGASAIRLRDWIDDLGELPGAIGWSDTADRPELVAQIVTACHVALESKPEPRKISGSDIPKIASVKADDLLATPLLHWRNIINNDTKLAAFLGEFQDLVGGGKFPHTLCPYPVTAAIYVALRWHETFDDSTTHKWAKADLDALFRAFFWRNALANRYDQGFLTQIGTDIREMKNILQTRKDFQSASAWAQSANSSLKELIKELIPTHEQLVDLLTTGRLTGATQRALLLPMLAGVRRDFVNPGLDISYPKATSRQLHHLYPKDWCRNNRSGALRDLLDPKRAERDWCESIANMAPLDRTTNAVWKAKIPGQYLHETNVSFENLSSVLAPIFIDAESFTDLLNGSSGMEKFWNHRAEMIADELFSRMTIHF
jgi:hypothetical protein